MARALPLRRALRYPGTLLCIDDQAAYLPVRKAYLESHGYEVFTASSGREGLGILKQRRIDGVIIDYRMPRMDGAEVSREIRRTQPAVPIIMLSGFPHEIPAAVRSLVNAVLVKGESTRTLLEALEAVLPNHVLKRQPATASRDSIAQTKKRVQHIREAIAERRRANSRRNR